MSILNAIGLRVAAVCMLLGPPAAQAKLYLDGPDKWYPGQTVAFRLFADSETDVLTLAFGTDEEGGSIYDRYASVLELQVDYPAMTDPVKSGDGWCSADGSACSYFYAFDEDGLPLSIPAGTLVTWQFRVRDDATPGPVSFDLQALTTDPVTFLANPIPWATSKEFEVLSGTMPVPESSSWILMLVGLVAVGARAVSRLRT